MNKRYGHMTEINGYLKNLTLIWKGNDNLFFFKKIFFIYQILLLIIFIVFSLKMSNSMQCPVHPYPILNQHKKKKRQPIKRKL